MPDIKKAVEFYKEVMGWYVMMETTVVKQESSTAIGQMCIDVFGDEWESFKIAHLKHLVKFILYKKIKPSSNNTKRYLILYDIF